MIAMLQQFFRMLETLFAAGEKGANAINHIAGWAEESAAAFEDEARIKRGQQATALTRANRNIKQIKAA